MIFNDVVEITLLPAGEGDCIIVCFINENYRILIDGGVSSTYDETLRPYLKRLSSMGQRINLIVVTHIDRDHIGGIIRLLEENGKADDPSIIYIDDIWYNGLRKIQEDTKKRGKISRAEKGILQNMAANNSIDGKACNGTFDISYFQGTCLAELIINNGYAWNKAFGGKSVIKENTGKIRIGDINITILNPTISILKRLYSKWVEELKSKCLNVVITDDTLFDSAFEGFYISEFDNETQLQTISSHIKDINWEEEAMKEDDSIDNSITNKSSIVLLIEYKGLSILLPGDYPIRNIADELPDCIDIVKLPHHGSGKNIDKCFIKEKKVSYYLLSTDGKRYNHPSRTIIGNIIKAENGSKLVKNYNIRELESIGVLENVHDIK